MTCLYRAGNLWCGWKQNQISFPVLAATLKIFNRFGHLLRDASFPVKPIYPSRHCSCECQYTNPASSSVFKNTKGNVTAGGARGLAEPVGGFPSPVTHHRSFVALHEDHRFTLLVQDVAHLRGVTQPAHRWRSLEARSVLALKVHFDLFCRMSSSQKNLFIKCSISKIRIHV